MKFNREVVIGIISTIILLFEIYGIFQILTGELSAGISITDLILIVLYPFVIYKTLIKKKKLSKIVLLIWTIIFILFLLTFVLAIFGQIELLSSGIVLTIIGFIIGLIVLYYFFEDLKEAVFGKKKK